MQLYSTKTDFTFQDKFNAVGLHTLVLSEVLIGLNGPDWRLAAIIMAILGVKGLKLGYCQHRK